MKSPALIGLMALALAFTAGCQGSTHGGGPVNLKVADLKVGGEAKLVSADGSDILLDNLMGGSGKGKAQKSAKSEKLKLPAGTTVKIQKIVGDDAQVEIKDGPSAGSQCWVECLRLEPVGP